MKYIISTCFSLLESPTLSISKGGKKRLLSGQKEEKEKLVEWIPAVFVPCHPIKQGKRMLEISTQDTERGKRKLCVGQEKP